MSDWKRRRQGAPYMIGVRRRQVRVGRKPEPITVVRLLEDMKAGDEIVLTRRDVRFAAIGMETEMRRDADA